LKNIYDWLDAYGESHQNKTNKQIHWVCVPVIMVTLLGLLSMINFSFTINKGFYHINLAGILIILAIIFYIRLSVVITLGMVLFSGLCIQFINFLESNYNNSELFTIYVITFIIAWIGQFVGHKIEGKKPSFFEDIQFLLIGPAWLLSFIYKKLGIKY
tara:strand:+ start:334 stop:807 length:474 start_codon:yes stop_codon:yes gene_type:complete